MVVCLPICGPVCDAIVENYSGGPPSPSVFPNPWSDAAFWDDSLFWSE